MPEPQCVPQTHSHTQTYVHALSRNRRRERAPRFCPPGGGRALYTVAHAPLRALMVRRASPLPPGRPARSRSAPLPARPLRTLMHLPPECTPATQRPNSDPQHEPCSRHVSTGGVQVGTWRPLPPVRALQPPRSGASQRAATQGRSSCTRWPSVHVAAQLSSALRGKV